MKIKWRERTGLNPDALLQKLDACKKIEGDNVSFDAFDKIENEIAIATMLKFGEDVSSLDKTILVSRAIFECAKIGFSKDKFIKTINEEYQKRFSTSEKEYLLLTSIALSNTAKLPPLKVRNCNIQFLGYFFPKKFLAPRSELLSVKSEEDNTKFTKVIIKTKSRSAHAAGEACLNALNLVRSFLCLQLNPILSISSGSTKQKPINKIVLGKYHTLHLASGEPANEVYWYERDCAEISPYTVKTEDREIIIKNIRWFLKQIETVKFKKALEDALIRFVVAFDQIDYDRSVIMAWSSLESLLGNEKEARNDLIAKRCSFLFAENNFHRQVLEHIREYRNNNVHYGESISDSSIICYQLQRYFRRLVYFYLSKANDFMSRDEANSFLDLPPNVDLLRKRLKQTRDAIKYCSPTKPQVNHRT